MLISSLHRHYMRLTLRITAHALSHAERHSAAVGPDPFGDARIATLRRRMSRLKGRLLLTARSIHEARDALVVCTAFVAAAPFVIINIAEILQ